MILCCTGSSLLSRTRIKTLAYDTIPANARFFGDDISAVPRMALTVGVGAVLDSREVVVVVTDQRKSLRISKAIGASDASHRCRPTKPRPVCPCISTSRSKAMLSERSIRDHGRDLQSRLALASLQLRGITVWACRTEHV